MNTETSFKLPVNSHLVAAAVLSLIPGSSTLFAAQLFAGIVQKQFRKDDVENLGSGAFFGPGFVVAVVSVSELKPALRVIRAALEGYSPLNQYPHEIAYFDADESFWRTVHPMPALGRFERFLTEEIIKANQDECARITALLDAALKKVP